MTLRTVVLRAFKIGAMAFVASLCLWLRAATADAAEVNGIYTEPSTKDLGELTKIDAF